MTQQSAYESAEFKKRVSALFDAFAHIAKPVGNLKFVQCLEWRDIAKLLDQNQWWLDPQDVAWYFQTYDAAEKPIEVMRYLLPGALTTWARSFLENNQRTSLYENMTPTLAKSKLLTEHLNEQERESAYEFMRSIFCERLSQEKSLSIRGSKALTYIWFYQFCAYGVIGNDIPKLWPSIWEMSCLGHAIAVVQYASCLICDDDHNPVFSPWTREEGGGAPALWVFETLGFGECWQDENVQFLSATISPAYLRKTLVAATEILKDQGQRDVVAQLLRGMDSDPELVTLRCSKLPELLSRPSEVGSFAWETVGAR